MSRNLTQRHAPVARVYRHATPQVNHLSMAIGQVLDLQIREHQHAEHQRVMREQIGRQQKAVMERHAKIQENIRITKLQENYEKRLADYEEAIARGETNLTKPLPPAGLIEVGEPMPAMSAEESAEAQETLKELVETGHLSIEAEAVDPKLIGRGLVSPVVHLEP